MTRMAAAGAAAVVAALVASGCGGPRNSLNTSESVCFRSLAVAREAVHHRGKLIGVRRVSPQALERHLPETGTVPRDDACLVVFRGDYKPGDVDGARPPAAGRYAMVAVTTGQPILLGARVSDHPPLHLRHVT